MSGGIETAGDIATGTLLARAVEPRAGEHAEHAYSGALCLNCGTALIGEFCHACGQNGHVHRTLVSIGHDLVHGVFHFEGKVWRTVPMLLLHPGQLTRRYIDGERARFVSPLALFLFFVFLLFASIHTIGGDDFALTAAPAASTEQSSRIDQEIADAKTKLNNAQMAAAKNGKRDEGDIVGLKATLKGLQTVRDTRVNSPGGTTNVATGIPKTGWAPFDHAIDRAKANPALALYKLQSSASKFSWALIPISVPFVALLFLWRRQFKMYDHTIFVTYSLAFMMLLVTTFSLLLRISAPGWIAGCLLAFAPPIHLFAQLRGTYALGRFSSLWRTVALLLFGSVTITLFALLLIALGLME